MDREIFFDEENRVRILDVSKWEASRALQDDCNRFAGSMQQLRDGAAAYLAAFEQQAALVEAEKLKAVGLRNALAAIHEERRRKQQELQQQVDEQQRELDRLLAEEQSLITVRTTQQAMILQLTDARGGSSSSFY